MKKWIITFIAVATFGVVFWSCSNDDSGTAEPTNKTPTCEILSPSDSSEFIIGTDLSIEVNSTDVDGTVSNVAMYRDEEEIFVDSISPYEFVMNTTGLIAGFYQINVIATDDESETNEDRVTIKLIDANYITITSPNGGETWQIGTSQSITWNENITENVKIDLYKAGTFTSTIVSSAASSGTYSWTLPNTLSAGSDYKIRITGVTTTTLYDESDASFTINAVPNITVLSPNGSETWQLGTSQSITWSDNIAENVKIDLYKAGTFNSTIISSVASSGTYSWTLPTTLTAGSDYKIRITGVTTTSLYDESNANFTIDAVPNITVTTPNGSETWQMGSAQSITWSDNIAENVKIDLYKAGTFNSTIVSSVASSGIFSWTLPTSLTTASDYKIRITGVTTTSLYDESNAYFTINAVPNITVSAPNGGETWQMGSTQSITWTDNITENVKIDLYKAGTFNSTIISSVASSGLYSWTLPTTLTAGTDYKIRITGVTTTTLYDESNSNFTMAISGDGNDFPISALPLSIPHIGNYEISPSLDIDWYRVYLTSGSTYYFNVITSTIDTEFFLYGTGTEDGLNIGSLVANDDNSGGGSLPSISYVPSNSGYYYLRVAYFGDDPKFISEKVLSNTSYKSEKITGTYTLEITIPPFIDVINPDGGEKWMIGASQQITWTDNISEKVKIDLYENDQYYKTIVDSTYSNGYYIYPYSNYESDSLSISTKYKIRISSVTNVNLFSESENYFYVSNWPRIYYPSYGRSIQQTSDGGFVVFGSYGDSQYLIFKVDTNGDVEWSRNSDALTSYELGNCVKQTPDGGYICCVSRFYDGIGAYIVKYDSEGNKIWDKYYNGTFTNICIASDGNYILTGSTNTITDFQINSLLVKVDNSGNVIWEKNYGGTKNDYGISVQETSDGGYVIGGHTKSYGVIGSDAWLIRTDSEGNWLWSNTYAFTDDRNEEVTSVCQANDGGYYILAKTEYIWNVVDSDVWLIKTDSSGTKTWEKVYGGEENDACQEIRITNDGGLVIAGVSLSFGDSSDAWLIKTDLNGNIAWEKTYGDLEYNSAMSVYQTNDNGFAFTGNTTDPYNQISWVWIVKTDTNGNIIEWEKK